MATAATATAIKKEIIFDKEVLEKIAAKTAQEVDGILDLQSGFFDQLTSQLAGNQNGQGVSADIDADDQKVELELEGILEYGKNANEVFDKLTKKVVAAINSMTGYQVASIKLHVKDLLTVQQWREKQEKSSKIKISREKIK
ncbi:Asp23/Gls24 family envelope stress response protein [Liquorilactobacillus sicerae]|uniref:Asp23/Gls24 family envelope stress response protein n=1 Tax=Liquorilactobacillus sicerae TaxID=1416943 RepID=UPI002480B876|nr:Asp23/Gls24 family envelope stress response protein [Liquorilactobacillus sicerae]